MEIDIFWQISKRVVFSFAFTFLPLMVRVIISGFLETMEFWSSGGMGKPSLQHSITPSSLDHHCIKLAGLITGPALHTFVSIQLMGLFLFPGDGLHRANLQTGPATGTRFRVDGKRDQSLTEFGRALFVSDMGFKFISEIPNG
jgi:hypothetical protein